MYGEIDMGIQSGDVVKNVRVHRKCMGWRNVATA